MKKWGACVFSAVLCMSFLAGCGSEKLDISKEDEERVVNYAATVLTQHNAAASRSLASLSQKDLERIVRLDLAAAAQKAGTEETAEEETTENENPQENPNPDNPDGENSGSTESEEAEVKSIAEAIGLEGFDISYNGFEITDRYPNEETTGTFTISPGSDQDSLLVAHFNIFNPNSETMRCDLLDLKPSFRFNISGQKHSLLTTLLFNDLVMVDEDIEPGQTYDAVLIAEISNEKAQDISSLGLIVRTDDGNYEIPLE